MDQAQQAVDKLLGTHGSSKSSSNGDVSGLAEQHTTAESVGNKVVAQPNAHETVVVEKEVKPAVEHETIKREHETKEQEVIDKERHQHHYHTTVQPLKDREVLPTEHDHEQAPTEVREFDHDDGKGVPDKVDARQAEFKSKTEEAQTQETVTQEQSAGQEHVKHHVHESVQPVVEKETIQPSVTHKTIPVKEIHHEGTKDEGTTVKPVKDVDEFQNRLDGEGRTVEVVEDEAPKV